MQLLKTLALLCIVCMSAMVAAVAAKDLKRVSSYTLIPLPTGEFYRTTNSGHLVIQTGGGDQILTCSVNGWRQQDIYRRHNLPLLAEGCTTTGLKP